MASVWIPLNYPEPVDLSQQTIYPDITINSLYELSSILVFDEDPVTPSSRASSTSNNGKIKSARGCSTSSDSNSSMVSCAGVGCFWSSKNGGKTNSTAPYQTKRILSPPDLDNNNSNASDGS